MPAEDADIVKLTQNMTSFGSTCVVDEKIFKIPSSYRCTNHYLTFDSANMFDNDSDANNRTRNSAGAIGGGATNDQRRTNYYGHGVDDDDILLQLAIQQSVAMSRSNDTNLELDEQQLTALEMLGHRTIIWLSPK